MHFGLDADAYERHQRFFFDELMPDIRARFHVSDNPADVAIIGSSASAAWVLNQSSTREEAHYWGAFSLPTGSRISPAGDDGAAARVVMGGRTLDSVYLANSLQACADINASGGDCDFLIVRSGHGHGAWDELVRRMLVDWSAPGP